MPSFVRDTYIPVDSLSFPFLSFLFLPASIIFLSFRFGGQMGSISIWGVGCGVF